MKILVTGAHFTTAVAIIEQLSKQKNVRIVYVGRSTTQEGDDTPSQESQILPKIGVKFIPVIAGRLQRDFTHYTILSLLKIPIGLLQAVYIILKEKPDVILSFGGYVAVPLVVVGWLFSIPIIVHEQTLISGLASKITSIFADKIALSFGQKLKVGSKKMITGNPIRDEVINPNKYYLPPEYQKLFIGAKIAKLPVVLIMGGNQGSHAINSAIEGCLDKLIKVCFIIHATGDNKFGDFEKLKKLQQKKYLVKKWIGDEIGRVYSKINLVVSRAGINTLTELAYFQRPALLIPITYLYQDEQNKNAEYFKKLGLVQILPQFKLSPDSLQHNIKSMLNNLADLNKNAKRSKTVVVEDAAERIALETILLTNRF